MDVQHYYAEETIEATIDFKHGYRIKNGTVTFAHILHQDHTPQPRLRQQRPLLVHLSAPQVRSPVVLWLVYPVEHTLRLPERRERDERAAPKTRTPPS